MTSKAPHKSPRTRKLTSGERALWRVYTKDVARLHADAPAEEPEEQSKEAAPAPKHARSVRPDPAAAARSDAAASSPPGKSRRAKGSHAPELAHGMMTDLDRSTARKFFSGRMSIDGRIDLHGLSKERAHGALHHFIDKAYAQGRRCVLVITGKGTRSGGAGVLRREVPMWLNSPRLRSRILAFGHAQPGDGGEGALYVLIRRHRS